MADDTRCGVLGCGPFPVIQLDGHLLLLDPAEVSRIGASPDCCQTPQGGGTVNRTACGGMMLCAGRGSARAELARVGAGAKDHDGLTGPSPVGTIPKGVRHRTKPRPTVTPRPPVQDRRLPRPLQRRAQPGSQPRLISGLAQQDRAGVPDQARPAARHLQGMVPRRMLHDEERSDLEITGVVTA